MFPLRAGVILSRWVSKLPMNVGDLLADSEWYRLMVLLTVIVGGTLSVYSNLQALT